MRRFLLSWGLVAIMCGVALTSCTEDNASTDEPKDVSTELTLGSKSVEASGDGGTYSIDYTLTGGYEGVSLKVVSDVAWIKDITVDDTTITFTVEASDDPSPRTTILGTRYPGIDNQTITVMQLGGKSIFSIEISNETSTSCLSKITCADPEMAYIANITAVENLVGMGINTAEALYKEEHDRYKALADEHDSNLGQFMMINELAFYGESDIQWTGITPNTDYVLYVYGIEFTDNMADYMLATPMAYMIIRLKGAELMDIEFDVKVTVKGPEVLYEFEPIDWEGSYYIDIYAENDYHYFAEGETPSDSYCQNIVDTWLQMMNQYMASGYSGQQLMNIMCLKGKDSYPDMLLADTRYVMLFYAIDLVDGIPQVVSRPYPVHFKTEPVEKSDMTFDVAVTNVYTRVADVRVTPSANDEMYTVALLPTSDVPEGSNLDIINWYITTFRVSSYEGEIVSHVNSLSPETGYTLIVFGYYGGVITTDLYREDFTTEPEGECENSVVRVDFMGPYSPMELAKHYPDALNGMEAMYEQYGYYVMWAEIITEKPSQDVFYLHYEPSELENEGDVFKDLVSIPSPMVSYLTARSGVEFVMCGVTMDYRGNYSEMWKSEPFTYVYPDDKRPIEELISKLVAPTQAGRLMVVAPDGRHSEIESIFAVRK